jgi:hypothetical protein
MPRRRSGSELDALHAQAAALHEKIRTLAARNRARQLANDKRRCLLAGEAALEYGAVHGESAFAHQLLQLIESRARSQADRALFGLKPLPKLAEAPGGTREPQDAGSSG